MRSVDYVATCNAGLEEIASREVRRLIGSKPKKLHEGAIAFRGKPRDMFLLNYCSRSLHRIILCLWKGRFSDLGDIYRKIRKLELSEYIAQNQSFAVVAERLGEHDFTSVDLAATVGKAIIDSYRASKGVRLKVNLDSPDVCFRCEARENHFWMGIDTTGESLHKRWYRKFSGKAPVKSTIAASMIMLSEFRYGETLLDPFCGVGTIPIEAALLAQRKAPNQNRSFAFENLEFLDLDYFEALKQRLRARERKLKGKIEGIDIASDAIEQARANARAAGVRIRFRRGDATRIGLSCDRLVSDLPFGIRTSPHNLRELYAKFFSNLARSEVKRAVLLTTRWKWVFEDWGEVKQVYEVDHGGIRAKILVLE